MIYLSILGYVLSSLGELGGEECTNGFQSDSYQ